jgi:pyridoxamine 5'-phosphate oxidase
MNRTLSDLRKTYTANSIDETSLPSLPMQLFSQWFQEVTDAGGVDEVNAMTLSTVDAKGKVWGRVVLLKDIIDESFVFYTNYESAKSQAVFSHPKISLSFFWPNLERQVIISGIAKKAAESLSDTYFKSRPRGSQLGAHVSPQSQPIASRQVLMDTLESITKKFEDKEIPRPINWGGIIVEAQQIEFWQGRPDRLHDRILYSKGNDCLWSLTRLAP